MSWHALTHGARDAAEYTNIWTLIRRAPRPTTPPRPARSLGTATADARWRWASPHAGRVTTVAERSDDDAPIATPLLVTRELHDEMAAMAQSLGRSEDEIWAEAAREWLLRRLRNDEPPPTTPAAAPVPNLRTRRLWNEIDAMLADLRHPRHVAAPREPNLPAA